jgi:hypothetical protein
MNWPKRIAAGAGLIALVYIFSPLPRTGNDVTTTASTRPAPPVRQTETARVESRPMPTGPAPAAMRAPEAPTVRGFETASRSPLCERDPIACLIQPQTAKRPVYDPVVTGTVPPGARVRDAKPKSN